MLAEDPNGGYRKPIVARSLDKDTETQSSSATGSVISVSSSDTSFEVQEIPYVQLNFSFACFGTL